MFKLHSEYKPTKVEKQLQEWFLKIVTNCFKD